MKKLFLLIVSIFLITSGCSVFAEQPSSSLEVKTEAKLYYNEGVDYYKLGQYDRAMASFRKAIDTDVNYIDAYYNLGSILEYLKQDVSALEIFKQIIVRKPDDYDAVYKAANLSYKLGNPENAKAYLALIPSDARVFTKAQDLAYKLGSDIQTLKYNQKEQAEKSMAAALSNQVFENIISPTGITSDKSGNIYVACFSDNTIYKITPDGKRILYLKDARISGPIGLAMDDFGNLYIANYNKDNIIKVSSGGQVSILLGNVLKPYGVMAVGNTLYISSQGSNSIVRYGLSK